MGDMFVRFATVLIVGVAISVGGILYGERRRKPWLIGLPCFAAGVALVVLSGPWWHGDH